MPVRLVTDDEHKAQVQGDVTSLYSCAGNVLQYALSGKDPYMNHCRNGPVEM